MKVDNCYVLKLYEYLGNAQSLAVPCNGDVN